MKNYPHFTTPCFINIEDSTNVKALCDALDRMGYLPATRDWSKKWKTLFAYQYHIDGFDTPRYLQADALDLVDLDGSPLKGKFIDCGTNVDLFIRLAGMRDDTVKEQWFISKGWEDGNGNPIGDKITQCMSDTLEQWGLVNNSPNSYNRNKGNKYGWERVTAQEFIDWLGK